MRFLGVFVAVLTASLATGLLLEEEERAVVQGSHCDYIILSDVPKLSGCSDGFKFVIRKTRRVRSQYLVLGGKTVLAFLKTGQKFSQCKSFNNITPTIKCKGPIGGLQPNFTPGNWTGGDNSGACPEFCVEIYQPVCGSNGETYSNGCYLQMAACASTTPITEAYQGECAECPAERPDFGSPCSLPKDAQCPYGEECCCGQCHPSMLMECGDGTWAGYNTEACMRPDCGNNTSGCPAVCPAIFDPVCGSDGNTYSNDCQLQIASCNSPTLITVASQGECAEGPLENQTIAWVRGMTPAQLCVIPGTRVTFDWTSGHNMLEVTSESYESCTGFANTSPESGPAVWLAPSMVMSSWLLMMLISKTSNAINSHQELFHFPSLAHKYYIFL